MSRRPPPQQPQPRGTPNISGATRPTNSINPGAPTRTATGGVSENGIAPQTAPVPTRGAEGGLVTTGPRAGGSTRTSNVIAEEALQEGQYRIHDEASVEVTRLFLDFLHNFNWEPPQHRDQQVNSSSQDDSTTHTITQGQETQRIYPYKEQAIRILRGIHPIPLENQPYTQDGDEEDEDGQGPSDSQITVPFPQTLFVDFQHLRSYNLDLADAIESDYTRFESSLRLALQTFLRSEHFHSSQHTTHPRHAILSFDDEAVQTAQIAIFNMPAILPIRRALRTEHIARLTSIAGTVTRSTDVRPELLIATFVCTKCHLDTPPITQQYHFTRPTLCRNPRCQNRSDFQLDVGRSVFVDWQKLRVQENSDEIPPGSMPRSLDIVVRADMVERAKAGDRIVFTGTLVVIPDASALARAGEAPRATRTSQGGENGRNEVATGGGGGVRGLKLLGVRELTYRTCFVATCVVPMDHLTRYRSTTLGKDGSSGHQSDIKDTTSPLSTFLNGSWSDQGGSSSALGLGDDDYRTTEEIISEMTEDEKDDIRRMKATSNLFQKMVQSIAPSTYGHDDIKRGILLQLLGGVHKTTSEGIRLRGDINICIIGDPSTAKSQFLKFVHAFLPNRSVYTSGKASSAAGLTAAVMRDQEMGEFSIEAGALMLADNGICCIDEFDKMDPHDQVAIHEAMEQQTISITKAGIQATLNARASILAAANPIYGRYDRTKTLKANISLSAPILSRFDLFFVVLDDCDETSDNNVATHILNVHRCEEESVKSPFTVDQMQRYIRFARTINPKIGADSQKVLVDYYRLLRQNDAMGRSRTAYRITVRQLESMIRLSEAIARLFCDETVRPQYVREAYRLLQKSIMHVESNDVTFDDDDDDHGDEPLGKKSVSQQDIDNDESMAQESHNVDTAITRDHESGQVDQENSVDGDVDDVSQPATKKIKHSKKKVKISYEEYVNIMKALTTYLRSREKEVDDGDREVTAETPSRYLTWRQVLEWYLKQKEVEMGESVEETNNLRKRVNLVIRRLITVDHVLMYVGGDSVGERSNELDRTIAVHPNIQV